MTMRSEVRLMAIKEKDVSYHLGGTLLESDWEWLIKQAEKYQQIEQAWNDEQDKETIFFLRKCKEVIEGVEIPKKKRMP